MRVCHGLAGSVLGEMEGRWRRDGWMDEMDGWTRGVGGEAERSWRKRWRQLGRWRQVLPTPKLLLQDGGPGQLLGHLEP